MKPCWKTAAHVSARLTSLVLLTLAFSLSGCMGGHTKDGPPAYRVDVSKIPNAIPRPEKRARYGNMRKYTVFGKTYYPKRSSNNFTQTGIASWYGTKFHDRKTSSGEPYDMLAMTAAHKTLPLPTYVEVTNLRNNKKIIVKVNDRGPFASNRIIDLSYVAAKKLGMLAKGTTQVKIRAINPYEWAKNQGRKAGKYLRHKAIHYKNVAKKTTRIVKHAAQKTKQYVYLQAGAFRSKANALRLKKKLANLVHYPVQIHNPPKDSKLYRVRVGPMKDTASTKQVTRKLNNIGIKPSKIHGA